MDPATPKPDPSSSTRRPRSSSRPGSRPHTPLRRPNSRSEPQLPDDESFPLNALKPAFAELSDAMQTLEYNFGQLQTMHDSISRFNESFASFLYGLNMNAYCADFTEMPSEEESFRRVAEKGVGGKEGRGGGGRHDYADAETTFMTTDTSFVAEPPSMKSLTPALKTPAKRAPAKGGTGTRGGAARGGRAVGRGRGMSFR